MQPPAASDVERRKKVRLRIRRDLEIGPQRYEGRVYYVVKDPVSLRYYRFKEQEHFLIHLMDGTHTLDEAQKEYEKRFRPERLTLEDLEGFGQQLLTAGLAQNESPQAGKQLFDRRKKRRRSEWMQTLTNILYIKIPVFDPDKVLTRMLPYLRWIFTSLFMLVSIGVMLAAIVHVATHFDTFWEKLPSKNEFFRFGTIGYLWVALALVKVIHEFGHGLSCKAFGGEVHEMGLLFLVFSPCLYCNVSDAWTLPDKWKRIIISFAGIYVELIIAAISTFVWWYTPASPVVNYLALSLMVVCSVSTFIFNANPLMRYDGYYILADGLEIPNLRDRSNRFLQRLVMDYCLGIEVQPEQYMALWRRIMFVAYAVISYIYRWVITFSILYFMSQFLKPYKLGVVSGMLAVAAAGSMVGWPLFRLGKNLHKRGRMPDMKPVRVALSSIVLGAFLIVVFFVPLPICPVRQQGYVHVRPEYIQRAVLELPGILEDVRVRDGQEVQKGQVLAQFRSLDMENQILEARTQRDIYDNQFGVMSTLASQQTGNPHDRAGLEVEVAKAGGERNRYAQLVTALKEQNKVLELKAPCQGIVMSPPPVDGIGRFYEKGTPFCSIGDPKFLRVTIPVEPQDYRLLERDLRKRRKNGESLPVTIRVQGRAEDRWQGRISQLPESEAKEIPVQLTSKAGGTVATKRPSAAKPNTFVPQDEQYLVGIDLLNPDSAICPGTMARTKIHCGYHTAAWWVWRKFSSAFNLGMDWSDLIPAPLRPSS